MLPGRKFFPPCGLVSDWIFTSLFSSINHINDSLRVMHFFKNSSFQKKKLKERESGKELRLKLKDYYSKKESKSNSEKTTVQALALTRGKLLQETSQKNITSKLNESEPQNKIVDSAMETEDSTATLSNLDSEQTDAMDDDLPDMSGKRRSCL